MAKLTKPPIPAKMYKHFAVATVSLTGAIAMFADDGNRDRRIVLDEGQNFQIHGIKHGTKPLLEIRNIF